LIDFCVGIAVNKGVKGCGEKGNSGAKKDVEEEEEEEEKDEDDAPGGSWK
jgi:hypothetical protein